LNHNSIDIFGDFLKHCAPPDTVLMPDILILEKTISTLTFQKSLGFD